MVNFLKSAIANPLVASITAFTFTTAVMAPPPAYAANINLNLPAINFGIIANLLSGFHYLKFY